MANMSNRSRIVFVGNIPYHASEQEVMKKCEEIGPIVSFRLMCDKQTEKRKGFGFCEYMDEVTALSAVRNLNGQDLRGRKLRVNFAANDKNSNSARNRNINNSSMGSNDQNQLGSAPSTALTLSQGSFLNNHQASEPASLNDGRAIMASAFTDEGCQGSFLKNDQAPKRARLNDGRAIPISSYTDQGCQGSFLNNDQASKLARLDGSFVNNDHGYKHASQSDGMPMPFSTDKGHQGSFLINRPEGDGVRLDDRKATKSSSTDEGSVCDNNIGVVKSPFSAEVYHYLLQQVKNLTWEKISKLPYDEQQQVIQLQQLLIQQSYGK